MSALCRASSARAASTSSRRPFPPRRPSRRRAAPRARGGEGGGDESIAELEALLAKPGKRRAKGGGRGVVKRSAGSSAGDGDAPRRMMPSVRASTDVEGEGLPPFWKEAGFEDKGLAGKLYSAYVGEKGLLWWLNQSAWYGSGVLAFIWVFVRFVGPALGLWKLAD